MIYRTLICAALLLFLSPLTANASIALLEDFEDNTLTFTASDGLFFDSANDYFGIVPLNGAIDVDDGPYTGFLGNNFFAAEDINDPQGPGASTQTLTFNVDISGFSDLSFSGLFAAGNHDTSNGDPLNRYDGGPTTDDFVRVTVQIDGGAVQNLLALEAAEPNGDTSNNELRVDTNFDGVGDGDLVTNVATAFSNLGITGTGSTLVLRVEVSVDANNEEIAFDQFIIEGIQSAVPEPTSAVLWGGLSLLGLVVLRRRD